MSQKTTGLCKQCGNLLPPKRRSYCGDDCARDARNCLAQGQIPLFRSASSPSTSMSYETRLKIQAHRQFEGTVLPERVEEYKRLYDRNFTLKQIARFYGYDSVNSIKTPLKRAGFKLRKGANRKIDQQAKVARYTRMYESGMTVQQIADKLHMNVGTVYHAMARSGYKLRTVEESRALTLKSRNEAICTAKKMGLTVPEICQRFNLSAGEIRRVLKKNGISTAKPKVSKQVQLNGAKYWRDYTDGFSLPEIGKRHNVSTSTVAYTLRQCGYKLRSFKEAAKAKRAEKLGILQSTCPRSRD